MAAGNKQSLEGIALLEGLAPASRASLEARCAWHDFKKGEQIIDRQSEERGVYFVTRGRVQIVNYSLSGREISFDDLEAGNYFGELATLDDGPRSANVVALEPTTVAIVSPAAFTEFLEANPKLAMKVMRRLSAIVRRSTERIMDLSTLGANNRVHAEILRQAGEHMDGENRAVINPVPNHSDIASRVSTTRETVARVLSDLTRHEILQREGKALVVTDVARLSEMVEDVKGE